MHEKFTFDIQAPKIKKKKLILVKSASENREHVALKLMAFMLFYDPRLMIEIQIGTHYKPDLVIEGNGTQPELWIDCGYVAVKKATSLAQKLKTTRLVFFKETRSEARNFSHLLGKRDEGTDRIEFVSFENRFIADLAAHFNKVNEVTLYETTETAVGVALNEDVFETEIYRD
ncbi:YaeQ family protein [Omnitrophica bacterium]|nr:YaeQ family protein [Candidatus Omnitrophota bacterium]